MEHATRPVERRPLPAALLVAIGAVPGACLRWWLADLRLANLLGCLCIGVILALGGRRPRLALVAGVGFCGSLTSFSSWILELDQALAAGGPPALLPGLAAVPAGLVATGAGLVLARLVLGLGRRWRRSRLRR